MKGVTVSKSPKSSPKSESSNRYASVLEAARLAHMAKAQSAVDARTARQQAFAAELAFLLQKESMPLEAEN
ncbi:MAG: hypothetical protein CVV27_16755 [Candidatus Melainabacteria bacterium HGW-Melainabacteria-1]|nr:MAG: hypothetical protein CVV27_16755 [Candidatus Melainabacteria bacterium HGW-Melainabacteria-1]